VLIERERRGAPATAAIAPLGDGPLAVAAITVAELLIGAHRADSEERRRRREFYVIEVLDGVEVLPFDLAAARIHARLWAELAAAGQMIGAHDLIIAATALSRDYSLLTINAREFGRVPGLRVNIPDL
jgi:tRNA(fMet)-specific endonuclease VapC